MGKIGMAMKEIMTNRIITSAQAVNEALAIMGERDSNVLLMAEGVDDSTGVYGTTKGLKEIYGNRMIEMPVSENAMVGAAIGAAMTGKRPVISLHRVEFALLAMEQIINNAAAMHYGSNSQYRCPLVIRMIVGRGWGQGCSHSQSLEAMFAHIPGLKVLMPTFPHDYKGMMIAAINDNNPVVVIENRWTHYVTGLVDDGYFARDISQPERIKTGSDITIVASSYMTLEAILAAEALQIIGVDVELFDLRVVRPLRCDGIIESVAKTGRLLTIDTGYKKFGVGAEIISQVTNICFKDLKAAPERLGLPEHPVPSSRGYLPGLYPNAVKIIDMVCSMLEIDTTLMALALTKVLDLQPCPIDVPNPKFKGPF